ncbi:hypothetical protein R3P38DRAFT_1320973 [Favolaschia claudopus]|uniref:Uncharacterized protein n=1 Tax=Favolaschia claudopus TaxID=2862362 RepID=A0AAW0AX23_9AGAR
MTALLLIYPCFPCLGGIGGNGGAATVQGGAGGKGEGPQFHLPAVTTWHNVEGNAYYSYHYYYCACSCMNPAPDATAEVVVEGRVVRPVRRLAEYIHGEEERTIAIIYCALYCLFPPNLVGQSHSENAYYDFRWIVQMFSRLLNYIRGDRAKAHFLMHCVSSALQFPGSLNLMDRLRLVPLIALPILTIPTAISLNPLTGTRALVDVTEQCRPISLAVWNNQEAFRTKTQDFLVSDEVIMNMIQRALYQIQDAENSLTALAVV